MPTTTLQPGSTDSASVKALQKYLVDNGYMTQAQVDTGPGIYGPKTTAAVAALQKDLGVDNSTGVGYFGPRTIAAVQAKATKPAATTTPSNPVQPSTPSTPSAPTMTTQDIQTMQDAVKKSLASNPEIQTYAGANDPDAILNAFMTGNWSGVVSLSGKPFTDEQQQAAVTQAESALAPAYKAQEEYDRANTEDSLRQTQQGFEDFQSGERKNFVADKNTLDQNAADQGVLFSGSRAQKLADLRTTYAEREAIQRRGTGDALASTARGYQYSYGNNAASGLKDLYSLPGSTAYNSNVVGARGAAPSSGISAAYNPSQYNFQGTVPVGQKAQVQTRAASLLANKANKLSLSGVGAKF